MHTILQGYLERGGWVNGAIFLVCYTVFYTGTGKLVLYRRLRRRLGLVPARESVFSLCVKKHQGKSPRYFYNRFREELLSLVEPLEAGLPTIAVLTAAAPLLGLLGTVVGMIETFSIITTYGAGNPRLLSDGISVALVTTQAGLLVAFPCLLLHTWLQSEKNRLYRDLIFEGERHLKQLEEPGPDA